MGTIDRVAVVTGAVSGMVPIARHLAIGAALGGRMPVRFTRLAVVVFALVVSVRARAEVPSPAIEGPIASPAGAFIGSPAIIDPRARLDFSQVGYEQQEYFISGTASAYTSTGTLGDDGMWSV